MEHLQTSIEGSKTSWRGLLFSGVLFLFSKVTASDMALWGGIISTTVVTLYTLWKWRSEFLEKRRKRRIY
ncbi:MAG: hypothetical protein JO301_17000 [Chitinophagaceae bacterium]|nr:hypothetical protein [Chitinophagaceae bacterium]